MMTGGSVSPAAMASGDRRMLYHSLLGIGPEVRSDGAVRVTLTAGPAALDSAGRLAKGALATLADRALSASVPRPTGEVARFSTVTLSVQIVRDPDPNGPVVAEARPRTGTSELMSTSCLLRDAGGEELGRGFAIFIKVRPPAPEALRAAFSEPRTTDGHGTTPAGGADPWQARVAEALGRLGDRPSYDALLGLRWVDPAPAGSGAEARLDIGPHLWNRVGQLHGGAVFGALAAVAARAVPGRRVLEQQCQLMAGLSEGRIRLRARPIRIGRRVGVVAVDATGPDDRPVSSALCTLIPEA